MEKKEKLEVGKVYPVLFKDEFRGNYLYMGQRSRFNVKREEHPEPVRVIAGYQGSFVDCLRFDEDWYVLKNGRINLTNKRSISVSGKELEYLEDRLERVGL